MDELEGLVESHEAGLWSGLRILRGYISDMVPSASTLAPVALALLDDPTERARARRPARPPGRARRRTEDRWKPSVDDIRAALRAGRVPIVYQPLLELATNRLAAVEALARFPRPRGAPLLASRSVSPQRWFTEAHRHQLGRQLEALAARCALDETADRAPTLRVAVNASSVTATEPGFQALLTPHAQRTVLELTEHHPVADYRRLRLGLEPARRAGVRLAVDDAGSGCSSLHHILEIRPEFIKLDRELIRGIDHDPIRRSLVAALRSFAGEVDAIVVAEGIETPAELRTVTELGIALGQGFALGHPMPIEALIDRFDLAGDPA